VMYRDAAVGHVRVMLFEAAFEDVEGIQA